MYLLSSPNFNTLHIYTVLPAQATPPDNTSSSSHYTNGLHYTRSPPHAQASPPLPHHDTPIPSYTSCLHPHQLSTPLPQRNTPIPNHSSCLHILYTRPTLHHQLSTYPLDTRYYTSFSQHRNTHRLPGVPAASTTLPSTQHYTQFTLHLAQVEEKKKNNKEAGKSFLRQS